MMLAKPLVHLALCKAYSNKIIRVRNFLFRLCKPLITKKQIVLPSREVHDAIHNKEETIREICEMMRWSIYHR
jgi:hypothetical protein